MSQPVARLGETVDLNGHHLDGTGRRSSAQQRPLRGRADAWPARRRGGLALMQFTIPGAPGGDFPVGVYRVGARAARPASRSRARPTAWHDAGARSPGPADERRARRRGHGELHPQLHPGLARRAAGQPRAGPAGDRAAALRPARDRARFRHPDRAGRRAPGAAAHRRHRQPDHRSRRHAARFLDQRINIT